MSEDIRWTVGLVKYRDWDFYVSPDRSYLQVRFVADGEAQHGRKWKLSPHMTRSEVVQTALAAVLAAEEHEARERFTYRGEPIFGPHFDVDALWGLRQELRDEAEDRRLAAVE
jgi:hypothetical protein